MASSEIFMRECLELIPLFLFMKVVHIQLSNKRGKVVVFKIFGEDFFDELVCIFYLELSAVIGPRHNTLILRVLKIIFKFKKYITLTKLKVLERNEGT